MTDFAVRVYKEYFNFASSHFLVFADGGREELHGHNYQVRVTCEGEVGPDDLVVDFCRLKPIVRRLCGALDHRMLLPEKNAQVRLEEQGDHLLVTFRRNDGGEDRFLFPRRDCALLPIANTSTERLAELLGGQLLDALAREVPAARLARLEVEVEESPGQCGVARLTARGRG